MTTRAVKAPVKLATTTVSKAKEAGLKVIKAVPTPALPKVKVPTAVTATKEKAGAIVAKTTDPPVRRAELGWLVIIAIVIVAFYILTRR